MLTLVWAALFGTIALLLKACGRHTPRGVSTNFLQLKKSRTRGDVNLAGLTRRQRAHQNHKQEAS